MTETLALASILLLVALLRVRLLPVPLERDEGDWALGANRLLLGLPLYRDFHTMQLPGIYFAYAAILSVFGRSIVGIHLGLLLMHSITAAMLHVAGRRLFGVAAGLGATAVFGIASSLSVFLGHTANSEPFLNFYSALALAAIVTADRSRVWQWALAGAAMGAAFVTKQHGAALVLAGGLWLVMVGPMARPGGRAAAVRSLAIYFGASVLPAALTVVLVGTWSAYEPFKLWVIENAWSYAEGISLTRGMGLLKNQIVASAPAVWPMLLLALAGLLAAALDRSRRRPFAITASYLAASLLMISVGFYFRPHYFLLACPPLALFAGRGLQALCTRIKRPALARLCGVAVITVVCAYPVAVERSYFFEQSPADISRACYGPNPFVESEAIGQYVAERSAPEDRILVLGSEPQIYFYANRPSATGHIYMYTLMENRSNSLELQEDLIREAEAAEPKYIIFVSMNLSWLREATSEASIFQWANEYVSKHYVTEAVVDVPAIGAGKIVPFDASAPPSKDGSRVLILKRREG